MTILNLVSKDHPLLHTPMEKFDFSNPPTDPIQLAKDLLETMLHHQGVGLAANQVGLPYRVFIMNSNPAFTCFNPRIVDKSNEFIYLDEGCLTYPGLFIKIKRPRLIKIRFTLPNGETTTFTWNDMTARIAQHEIDHLDGVVYTKRANGFHLEQARNKQRRFLKKKFAK